MPELTLSAPTPVTASAAERTVRGTATVYGVKAYASTGPVKFLAGSLRMAEDLSRVKLLVDHDHAQPVGYATEAVDSPERLDMAWTVPATPAGDAALLDASSGLRDGLSVGVWVDDDGFTFDEDDTLVVSSGVVREVSLCSIPAYDDARVSDVAASARAAFTAILATNGRKPMSEPQAAAPEAPAPVAAAPIAPPVQAAPIAPPSPQRAGMSLREMAKKAASLITSGAAGQVEAAMGVQAALVDIVPGDDAGESRQPQWVGELWSASNYARPIIDALGTPRPLTALKVLGFRKEYDDLVDDYTGNKTEIPSFEYATLPAEAAAQRIAGGNDVDRAYVDLGGGDFLEGWFTDAVNDYRKKSEAKVATALLAGATPIAGTTTVLGAVSAIASALKTAGATSSQFVLSVAAWNDLSEITNADAPWWLVKQGNLSLNNEDGSVSDVSFVVNPALTGLQVMGFDARAATVYEVNPPVRVRAENIPNGGVDVGVFGYIAVIVNDPAAVYKATYIPVP